MTVATSQRSCVVNVSSLPLCDLSRRSPAMRDCRPRSRVMVSPRRQRRKSRMSPDVPQASPEAEVIRLARKAAGMTAESASQATRARGGKAVSATYWRDVERGHGGPRGQRVQVRASDEALAALALIVGAPPSEPAKARREGAARRLGGIHPPQSPATPSPSFIPALDADDEAIAPYEQQVRAEILQAMDRYGLDATGAQVFPDSTVEQATWDTPQLRTREEKVRLIAKLRMIIDGAAQNRK